MSLTEQVGDKVVIKRFSRLSYSQQKLLVLEYLAAGQPFASYGLKSVLDAIDLQLSTKSYATAWLGDRFCGYIGWVLTTRDDALAWRAGEGGLRPVKEGGNAAVITILAVADPKFSLPLVRFAFQELDGISVYWKRHIQGRGLIGRQIHRAR